jgi:hypothetical protein
MSLKLTAQLYKQILASLRSDSSSSRTTEKRGQGRVGLRCSVDIIPSVPNAKRINVWVRDISLRGIGIVSPVNLPEGTLFIAQLPSERESPLVVTYRVVHCHRINSDLYSVGCILETAAFESSENPNKPAAKSADKTASKARPVAAAK